MKLTNLKLRWQASVHGENLLIDYCCNRHAVEGVSESLPDANVVASFALVIEAIDAVDGSALMVSSKDEEVLGILYFECQNQTDGLQGLLPPVHIVTWSQNIFLLKIGGAETHTKEKVICLRRKSTVFKQPQQVIILTMNITTNLDGCLQLQQSTLAHKYFPAFQDQTLDFRFWQLYLFSWFVPPHLQKLSNDLINVDFCPGRHFKL